MDVAQRSCWERRINSTKGDIRLQTLRALKRSQDSLQRIGVVYLPSVITLVCIVDEA